MRNRFLTWAATVLLLAGMPGSNAQQKPVDLAELSLEDLMNLEVTLGSKKNETILETAAAIEVITRDDLRRSGATTIPEALRMVPGFDVARADANKWAISCRGFNNLFANKLLVLVDGRNAYSPTFAGVFWETQDLLFEDLDRIEVIRGPGTALWGANAVNGVINVITRSARDTRGVYLKTATGSREAFEADLRVGGALGRSVHGRVYAKYFERNPFEYETPDRKPGGWMESADGWHMFHGGFRIDGSPAPKIDFAFQGGLYNGVVGQTMTLPKINFRLINYNTRDWGGHLLGRVRRVISESSDMSFQMTFDRVQRMDNVLLGGGYRTFDAEFQHRFRMRTRHEIIWGAGYRITADDIDTTTVITFHPARRTFGVASAFIQDEIWMKRDRLRLTAGSRFEHNDLSGFEFQPTLRLLSRLDPKNSVWLAASRAVRTPTRGDQDIDVRIIGMIGSRAFKSERLYAYEIGSHHQIRDHWMVDLTGFFDDYYGLMSFENDTASNNRSARAYGAEVSVKWNPIPGLDWKMGYSYLHLNSRVNSDSRDLLSADAGGESPRHQMFMRTSLDLVRSTEADVMVRFVDALPSLGVKRYLTVDMRLAWEPFRGLELAVTGQNLNLRRHLEFRGWWIPFECTQTPRSVYFSVAWKR